MSQTVIGIMGKKFVDKDENLTKTCVAMQRTQPQNLLYTWYCNTSFLSEHCTLSGKVPWSLMRLLTHTFHCGDKQHIKTQTTALYVYVLTDQLETPGHSLFYTNFMQTNI